MSDQRMSPIQATDTSSNDSTPADRLRALLQRAELSQRGAARLLGIDERTMRQWCAGQGVPPDSVYRALDPRLTYSEHLRARIEANVGLIDALEKGQLTDIPRDYRPRDAEAAEREIDHLRKRNEVYRSILQLDDAFHRMQDAHAAVIQQWLPYGAFALTHATLHAFDAADQEFESAKAELDRVTEQIKAPVPLYKSPRSKKAD
jgi:transcriptional regulator with XRE-family HTH domain